MAGLCQAKLNRNKSGCLFEIARFDKTFGYSVTYLIQAKCHACRVVAHEEYIQIILVITVHVRSLRQTAWLFRYMVLRKPYLPYELY